MSPEDVPAVVIEAGTSWTRLGFAGDITPQFIAPTAYARDPSTGSDSAIYGDAINTFSPTKEIYAPVIDGVVHDWDAATGLWKHLAANMGSSLSDQPLMLVDPLHNPTVNRVKALSVAFEDLEVPLFSLAKAPLCAALESARTTALVVSLGSASAWVSPVIDGVVLTKASLNTRFAGDFVNAHVLNQLTKRNITVTPSYQVKSRTLNLDPGEPATAELGPVGTASFHTYQVSRVLDQFKQFVLQASPVQAADAASGAALGTGGVRTFEFPTGFSLLVGDERFKMAESLFKPAATPLSGLKVSDSSLGISELIYQSLNKIEAPPEVIINLLGNIIVFGGTSQLAGVSRRIENDLVHMLPSYSPRFYIPGRPDEKTTLTWTGGSILGSPTSFDRSWVTRDEYHEIGPEQLVEKRFK